VERRGHGFAITTTSTHPITAGTPGGDTGGGGTGGGDGVGDQGPVADAVPPVFGPARLTRLDLRRSPCVRQDPAMTMMARAAEEYLLGLELFGMRFGLDRMRKLMTVLGMPQRRFASIHVVGSNGKSSTARMIAAILERHGLRTGSYTSPHLDSFAERIEVRERPLSEAAFGRAVGRVARAAELVNRTLPEDDEVTQFEALTAAAYHELARSGVEVAVIEAGLGGRYDATNVIPSAVQVLTTVGLEHTRWLGPTIEHIAREKLAVVRDHAVLVTGPLVPAARRVAVEVAAARHARHVEASEPWRGPLRAAGRFQRTNFAVAAAAAAACRGEFGPLSGPNAPSVAAAVARAARELVVPGRLERIADDPLTVVDSAHNPQGARALAEALPEVVGERRLTGVVSILDDKDAAAMLSALLPAFKRVVFTRSSNPRALPPATLASLSAQLGGPEAETVPDPRAALRRAQAHGDAVLATGSIYLVADLVRRRAGARASTL
jgi:dihydrofolate synthase/folylpolyglutamate synthase